MNPLITSTEVAALAFGSSPESNLEYISESAIVTAQEKFIRPVVGAALYEKLEQGDYATLLDEHLKPALAHYVRYLILPSIASQVGSIGVIQGRGPNFSAVSSQTLKALCRRARADATTLMRRAVRHIENSLSEYPEYSPAENVLKRVSIEADIVL